ncbi:MAG: hypothetical protein P0S96_02670 [Simkaniaceae bacterium]|nr:hypothetical protein [Candidatus Sacchlamyda saccharinae]
MTHAPGETSSKAPQAENDRNFARLSDLSEGAAKRALSGSVGAVQTAPAASRSAPEAGEDHLFEFELEL